MLRFLAVVLACLLAAPSVMADDPPPAVGQIRANPSAARAAANIDNAVSTQDTSLNGGLPVYGDLQEFDATACYNGGNGSFCSAQAANVISFGNSGTTSTTVTAPVAASTLTLGSNAWCTAIMAGSPLYIAGVTAPNTLLTGCLSANQIAISKPTLIATSGATYTIQYGVNFQATCPANPAAAGVTGCVGSTVVTPRWTTSNSQSGLASVITAVNSPTNITVSTNSTNIGANNAIAHFYVGHDDSTAVAASCAYALAANLTLTVSVPHFVPTLDRRCYALKLRGVGRLATGFDSTAPAFATVFPEPVVVPLDALPPAPPRAQVVVARRDLPNLASAGVTPSIAVDGDSLEGLFPNGLSGMATYPSLFLQELLRKNPGFRPVQNICSVGGATVALMNGNPAATNAPCITSTGTSWLSQINTNAAPNAITAGFGNNDGLGMTAANLVGFYQKIVVPSASGGAMSQPADVVFLTHHPYSRITNISGNPTESQNDYASGMVTSFAEVMGIPVFDGAAEGEKHVWGYDPRGLKFERAFDINYGGGAPIGNPTAYNRLTSGISATFTKSGAFGSTFWSNLSGTDSRGPMIGMQIGTSNDTGNWLWIFGLSGGTTIGIECDFSNVLPGLGCVNPATGKPPVVPSLQGSVTVSSANPGVITTTTGFGWPCTVGMTVAVPGAGASRSVSASYGIVYYEPWITTVTACTSNTSVTGTGAAPTPGTFANSFVMSGNPVISTGVTDAGDGGGNEKFHVEFKGDDLTIWFNNTAQAPVYQGKVMRPRSPFTWVMFWGGSGYTMNIGTDPVTGKMTSFQTARPVPVLNDFVDGDVNGPSENAPLSNASYIGPSGGDGNNHNSSLFSERVLRPMFELGCDCFMPPLGVPAVTAATYTVPGCNIGRVPVNRAGTVTVTLAQNCAPGTQIVVQDVGGNAGGNTITVAGASGYTLSGTATITANYGLRTVTYTGQTTAVSN